MKTDLERFVELYKSFGIDCVVHEEDEGFVICLMADSFYGKDSQNTYSDKFDGYTYFHSDITFSKEGNFIKQGFWE